MSIRTYIICYLNYLKKHIVFENTFNYPNKTLSDYKLTHLLIAKIEGKL